MSTFQITLHKSKYSTITWFIFYKYLKDFFEIIMFFRVLVYSALVKGLSLFFIIVKLSLWVTLVQCSGQMGDFGGARYYIWGPITLRTNTTDGNRFPDLRQLVKYQQHYAHVHVCASTSAVWCADAVIA